jgi:hypothetical protein
MDITDHHPPNDSSPTSVPADKFPQADEVATVERWFERLKRQLKSNNAIAILLLVMLLLTQIGQLSSAYFGTEKLVLHIAAQLRKSAIEERKIAPYDENLVSGLIDLFQDVIVFTYNLEGGSPEFTTQQSRQRKYESFKGRLDVLQSIANAQESNEIASQLMTLLGSLVNGLETVDSVQTGLGAVFVIHLRKQIVEGFTQALRFEYARRAAQLGQAK